MGLHIITIRHRMAGLNGELISLITDPLASTGSCDSIEMGSSRYRYILLPVPSAA